MTRRIFRTVFTPIVVVLFITGCHRTTKNRFVINTVDFKIIPLYKVADPQNYYPSTTLKIQDGGEISDKYALGLFTIEKEFVSDVTSGYVPNEGMDGRLDSIISISGEESLFADEYKLIDLSNYKAINDLSACSSGKFQGKDKAYGFSYIQQFFNLNSIKEFYNSYNQNGLSPLYDQKKITFPILLDKDKFNEHEEDKIKFILKSNKDKFNI